MFGLSKLEASLVAAVLALLVLIGYGYLERRHGAQKCEAGDATVAAAAAVKNAHVEAAGAIADNALESTRAKAADAPLAPPEHVRVQPPADAPRACPADRPRPAAGAGTPGADVRAAGAPERVQPYLSPEWVDAINRHLDDDVRRGHAADVEIDYLRGLVIERDQVCRGQAPGPGPF